MNGGWRSVGASVGWTVGCALTWGLGSPVGGVGVVELAGQEAAGDVSRQAEEILAVSRTDMLRGRWDGDAVERVRRGLALVDGLPGHEAQTARLTLQLARLHLRRQDLVAARRTLDAAATALGTSGDPLIRADYHLVHGEYVALDRLAATDGRRDSVIASMRRALALHSENRNWVGVVEAHERLGFALQHYDGELSRSVTHYRRSIETARVHDIVSPALAEALLHVAIALEQAGNMDSALRVYHRTGDVARAAGIQRLVPEVLGHLARIRMERAGDPDSALALLNRAIDLLDTLQPTNSNVAIRVHRQAGDLYFDALGNHDDAMRHYVAARQLATATARSGAEPGHDVYLKVGKIYAWRGDHDSAAVALRAAWSIARRRALRGPEREAAGWLASVHAAAGRTADALTALARYASRDPGTPADEDGSILVALGLLAALNALDTTTVDYRRLVPAGDLVADVEGWFRRAVDRSMARDDAPMTIWALYRLGLYQREAGQGLEGRRNLRAAWELAARKGRAGERRAVERALGYVRR